MQFRSLIPALAVTLGVAACGEFVPTAPEVEALETEASYDRGAVVDPEIPATFDENLNGFVCIKVVPASDQASERAGQRVIVKDDTGGADPDCPGGFELTPVEPKLPG